VPFAAGGATDVIARIVGERLSKTWGQQVLIENRPGGGTNIANEIVARSEPDGHTILMGGSSQAITRVLYRSLNYDPIGDFAPVALTRPLSGRSANFAKTASNSRSLPACRMCSLRPRVRAAACG
jgi:tripartite-type tricarboxylate transporter receptor subunit TctC